MLFFSLRRLLLGLIAFALALSATGRAAELVWSPETGWRIEGGALATVTSSEMQNALHLMNKARTAEEKGSLGSAIKYYTRVTKKYPNSLYAPEAFYRLGKLRLARKQYTKAFDALQVVATRYPSTTRFNELIGLQYQIAASLVDGARGRIWGVIPGFTNREKGVEQFEIILLEAPYSDYAPLALMSVAQAHLRQNDTEESIYALDRLINSYPQSLLLPDAYLSLAKAYSALVQGAYYDQASTRDAITYYEDFLILFPSDQQVAQAEKGLADKKRTLSESKLKIGDFYFYRRSNYKAARVFYNEAITVYPDSDIASKARERLTEVDAAANQQPDANKKRFFFF